MRDLFITEFSNKYDKSGRVIKTKWPELIKSLQTVGHVKLADKESGAAIVGAPSVNGRHKKTSFKYCDIMIFDCDHVSYQTLHDWLQSNLGDVAWFLYSTYSHTWFDGRFRVMIPSNKPIPSDDYHFIWDMMDIPGKDLATKDISRLAFLPANGNGHPGIMLSSNVTDNFYDFLEIPKGGKKGTNLSGRNSTITQIVGSWLNGKKVKKEMILKNAKKLNQERCNPPLSDEELDRIIESIYEKEMEARVNGKEVFAEKSDAKTKIAVELALANIELVKGEGNEAIAKLDNCYYMIESNMFESWLVKLYYDTFDDILGRGPYKDAIHTLCGIARSKKDNVPVFRRIGYNEDRGVLVYYLGGTKYVQIDGNGWNVVDDSCGLCFILQNNLVDCVMPVNEDPENLWYLLRQFFNVNDQDYLLILSWIIGTFWPFGPFPVLIKTGEQGSTKSTGSEYCVEIVDNRTSKLIKPPKDSENLYVSAHSRHVLGIDNVSFIDDELSDDLCRLATGAGLEKRKLYTDTDTIEHKGARPVILNSILSTIVGRGDLLDRAIVVQYKPVNGYKSRSKLDKELQAILPRVYGAIFTILSKVVKNQNKEYGLPVSRMADFENRILSTELSWVSYFAKTLQTQKLSTELAFMSGDEIYEAIIQYFNNSGIAQWEGLVSDFVKQLDLRYDSKYKNSRSFGRHLERIKPNLRKLGLFVNKQRRKDGIHLQIIYKEGV